ncbi:uncharacterized protein, partial [Argopecten irradians]|uniref:uncharacterized protein n=1 Tax=Argopecten irradians TaxID=31199 RepID=UPI0037183408
HTTHGLSIILYTSSCDLFYKDIRKKTIKNVYICFPLGIGVDISPCIRSIGIQCDLLPSEPRGKVTDPEPPIPAPESPVISVVDSEDTLSYLSDEDASLYQPSLSDNSSDSDIDSHEDFPSGPSGERKFIVCESNLMELFQVCRFCGNEAHGEIKHVMGTLVKIETVCASCTFPTYWYSQPFVGAIPSVNLAMSASILFSGAIPTKALRMFQFMNISHVSKETFMLHQKNYLFPAISFCWNSHQSRYNVQDALARGTQLVLGGDGRADTPGHSAKYGSYGLMDLQDGVVIDIQLVQSNEVKSSNNMEKEGLVRAMSVLKERGLSVGALVTDRHLQIQKWVRENMPTTDHYYDVWHVAKGLKKKLCSLAKEKDCGEVTDWIKSLTNHLYWCAASTPPGEGNIMWAKWVSLENHIQNIHHGHGNLFPDCAHPDMDPEVRRRKKWLKPGTKACEKVGDLITSRQMKRDIPKLSPEFQTSEIEAYHSTINHFAPKMIGFSYHGMYCRLLLAAMHFNENSGREQSLTKEGIPKYNIVYPKYKKGEHTIRQMKIDQSFYYVENLMSVTTQITKKVRMHNNNSIRLPTSVPAPLCSDYLHPDKEEAISSFSSRFARKETSA